MDPIAFQTKWRTASLTLKERTASQSHFNDLCALVGVQNPPLMIVSDLHRIEVRTNFTNSVQRTEVITIDDLSDPTRVAMLKRVWTDPEWFRPDLRPDEVTREATPRNGSTSCARTG